MTTMSPDARGILIGTVFGSDMVLPTPLPLLCEVGVGEGEGGGKGLCFITNSRSPPRLNDAILGSGPRNRSSSEWNEILSFPLA